jgi:NADH pyrophosphatase NudC (nudix superfamily)
MLSKATLYKIGYPIAKIYWFFRRPTTAGVRCIITCGNQILLIKHTYGSSLLTTVGGGVKPGESLEQAVVREISEEVGLSLQSIKHAGSIEHKKEFKKDTIHVFSAITHNKELQVDPAEIKEAGWFDINDLPENISPLFKKFYRLVFQDSQEKF